MREAAEPMRSLVRVDLTFHRTAGAPDVRFDAQAHFVRYRAFDAASVGRLLGLGDLLSDVPLDQCVVRDGTRDLDEALAPEGADGARALLREVQLLDAGRVEVRGPADATVLLPAYYPEVVPFVSGLVYAAHETRPVSLMGGQVYHISGGSDAGEAEVGGFQATVQAPRAFPGVEVTALRRGGDLDLAWSPEPAQEPLLVEVKWVTRGGSRAARCRVRDDGQFTVPSEVMDALAAGGAPSSATVTATRLSRVPLNAPGVGRGELTLELRDGAPLPLQP
jgi:hypothetical protein